MRVVVKLFGAVREAAGAKELSLDLPDGACVADLRDRLSRDFPVFDAFGERLAVSVNLELVEFEAPLHEGDEVAFLPPVSGGAGTCSLAERSLDVGSVVARVSGPGVGGIVTFVGTVRDRARGRSIRHLEYEAYPAMAESEMAKIVTEARERYAVSAMALVHRTGILQIGEVAVGVAVAAPHRRAALEACGFAIEELKRTVPIWKKEVFQGGEVWIEDHPKSSSSRSSSSIPR